MSREEDYRALGLAEGATPEEVRRAYHRMKALYAEGSLGTYNLMMPEERENKLDEIERAYMRLSSESHPSGDFSQQPLSPELAPPPDPPAPGEGLGIYLKRCRENLGLTLKDVAAKTRIRTTYLEHIEREDLTDLPAPVYLRGFILEYARLLNLTNPEEVAAAYLRLLQEGKE